ncbi:MAG: phosphoribosyltransferase [Actinomycetota bacterium]|nr:phosphoribosyltransferase [Actinomycetota bacterium]
MADEQLGNRLAAEIKIVGGHAGVWRLFDDATLLRTIAAALVEPFRGKATKVADDRVLLVDDWIETASQARAAKLLVEDCGAQLIGVATVGRPVCRLWPMRAALIAGSRSPSVAQQA